MKWILALLILILLLPLALFWVARHSIRRGAREIYRLAKLSQLAAPRIEIVHDARQSFPRADHDFYARSQATLQEMGFVWLGDVEYASLRELNPAGHTFIRVLAESHGTVSAGVYHIRVAKTEGDSRTPAPLDLEVIEFRTTFADGSSVLTGPRSPAAAVEDVPGHFRFFEDPEMDLVALHRKHMENVTRVFERRRGGTLAPVRSLADEIAALQALAARRIAYRREIGALTFEELRRMAPANCSPWVLRTIWTEVSRLAAREQA